MIVIQANVSSGLFKSTIEPFMVDLPLYSKVSKNFPTCYNRNGFLFFDGDTFIGYVISCIDFYKINESRICIRETKSAYSTFHISYVEVRNSLLVDKTSRYGQQILNYIISDKLQEFDGITLHAMKDVHKIKVYPMYGFKTLGGSLNGMVLWK